MRVLETMENITIDKQLYKIYFSPKVYNSVGKVNPQWE